jgi:excisionase family DNA binding protein
MADDGKRPLSTSDAASFFGVSERTVRRWIAAGSLDSLVTPGGHFRISPDAITDTLNAGAAAKKRLRPGTDHSNSDRPRVGRSRPPEPAARTSTERQRQRRRPALGTTPVSKPVDVSDAALRAMSDRARGSARHPAN